jgi:Flp pilus assembly CpaE family ATPase
MTPSTRSLLHVAIDAGLVTDISIVLPDREAIDRQLAALKAEGWEVGEPRPASAVCLRETRAWWQATASQWQGDAGRHVTIILHSQPVAEERAA